MRVRVGVRTLSLNLSPTLTLTLTLTLTPYTPPGRLAMIGIMGFLAEQKVP